MVISNDSKKILSFIQSHDSLISKKRLFVKTEAAVFLLLREREGMLLMTDSLMSLPTALPPIGILI